MSAKQVKKAEAKAPGKPMDRIANLTNTCDVGHTRAVAEYPPLMWKEHHMTHCPHDSLLSSQQVSASIGLLEPSHQQADQIQLNNTYAY